MSDLVLLKMFADRANYERYIDYVNLGICTYEVRTILEAYKAYYKTCPSEGSCLCDAFRTYFNQTYIRKPEEINSFGLIFDNIGAASDEVADAILQKYEETATKKKIEDLLERGFNADGIKSIITEHEKRVDASSAEVEGFVENDLDVILTETDRRKGFKWRLKMLNAHVGGLTKGDLVIVGAGVDVGKTMFCISEACWMARQLQTGKVLYLNNEQRNSVVMKRAWQSVLGLTEAELEVNRAENKAEYLKRMHGDLNRITFIDIQNKSLKQVTKILEHYKPKLCVIDMADNMVMLNEKTSEHVMFSNFYNTLRGLAKEYCPIIVASQTDVSTTYIDKETYDVKYKLYPHHRQLGSSKVGKPGAADIIIMIGRLLDYPNQRGIHISKNKYGESGIQKQVTFLSNRVVYKD